MSTPDYWPEAEIIPLPVTPPTRPRERWQDHAACAGTDPALFFPDLGDTATAQTALAICHQCPVRTQCLNEHIHEKHGVWGGTTAKERVALRRQRQQGGAA